jgi:hypothetical protein
VTTKHVVAHKATGLSCSKLSELRATLFRGSF